MRRRTLVRQDFPYEPDIYPFELSMEPLSRRSCAKNASTPRQTPRCSTPTTRATPMPRARTTSRLCSAPWVVGRGRPGRVGAGRIGCRPGPGADGWARRHRGGPGWAVPGLAGRPGWGAWTSDGRGGLPGAGGGRRWGRWGRRLLPGRGRRQQCGRARAGSGVAAERVGPPARVSVAAEQRPTQGPGSAGQHGPWGMGRAAPRPPPADTSDPCWSVPGPHGIGNRRFWLTRAVTTGRNKRSLERLGGQEHG
jgi:hypothetical protein